MAAEPLYINRDELYRSIGRDDPAWWVDDRLREFTWSVQRKILESVRDHRRTAVHSCHSSGKSWLAARIACWWIETHEAGEAFVVTSAPTAPQVRAILWREIGRAHTRANLRGRTNQTEWHLTPRGTKEEMVAFGRKPSDFAPDAFQGIHARYVLVIFDEACGIPSALWDAADTLISNEDSRFLAIGNPDDPLSEFAEVCKPGSGWNVIGISAFDTPNFTDEKIPEPLTHELIGPTWVEEKKGKWGEDNPLYISKILGEFPDTTEDGLIPLRWIRQAQERELEPSEPVELGVDVGGGGDRNVIAVRRGPVVRVTKRDQTKNTMQTLGNVMTAILETGATKTKIDSIGIGRGTVDRAMEMSRDANAEPGTRQRAATVVGVNVGQAARNPEQFVNLRAEGYWGLRERFEDGTMDIDPADEDLAAQLADMRYKRTSSGKIQIESKDEMRRRGRASPDEADAVMLSFLADVAARRKVKLTWGR